MKKILIMILHLVRRILTAFKNHCLPISLPSRPSIYDMYLNEEIKKCLDIFKPHFKTSMLLEPKNYHKFIIERAKENDLLNIKFYIEFGVWRGSSINLFSKYVNR